LLNRVHIEGFKSIKSLGEDGLELTQLNVVIGPNGAGKSNLISAFKLLGLMLEGRLQEFVARQGGASRLLHHGPKTTPELAMRFDFNPNGYSFNLVPTLDDRLVYKEEIPRFDGYSNWKKGISLGSGHLEAKLEEASNNNNSVAGYVFNAVSNWIVFHFHDTSDLAPPKQTQSVDDNRSLKANAGNIAAFLFRLKATHLHNYRRIIEVIQMIAPFFDDFRLAPLALRPSDIKLEWKQKGTDTYFDGAALSDGTLRFICLATLLLQPTELMPSLLLIDEPELGLHPAALTCLAELIEAASKHRQIILATQSPTLLDHFQAKDVIVAEQHENGSVFKRLETDKLTSWLEEYGIGELWLKNELGGRP
jgi:predicted ATPase